MVASKAVVRDASLVDHLVEYWVEQMVEPKDEKMVDKKAALRAV